MSDIHYRRHGFIDVVREDKQKFQISRTEQTAEILVGVGLALGAVGGAFIARVARNNLGKRPLSFVAGVAVLCAGFVNS